MQTFCEPAGAPVNQHVQWIASPDPLALHVRANARVGVDMIPNRTNTVVPVGPDTRRWDELMLCGQRRCSMRIVQRDLQKQPTAIRKRPNDADVDRHEREARRATNDPGTRIPSLELFEPQQFAQPTPEGLWGRTGRDGRTGSSAGGKGVTGGRLGFSGDSGFSGGSMGFFDGSAGFMMIPAFLPRDRR